MLVGTEWIIDAFECDAEKLRDENLLREIFARIVGDLNLTVIKEVWHQFPAEFGVTGFALLSESHLACHTYPEHRTATFNLYCCRQRPEWNWEENLRAMLEAKEIKLTKVERGNISQTENRENKKLVHYGEASISNRGRLPHLEKEDGIYFVTFRLEDSLPQETLQKNEVERKQTLKALENLNRELSKEEKQKIDWIFSEKVDEYLDKNYGECHLRNAEIANVVADALQHFDGKRYHLFAWCVMPNHVHVVFRTIQKNSLDEILHSWKSFTANRINQILGREGRFWQREYYDHLVRDQGEFERIIQYVADNPTKANLKNWKWVWAYAKHRSATNL